MYERMEKGTLLGQSLLCLLLMATVVALESFTDIDIAVQRAWYSHDTASWFISKTDHEHWRWLFYGGMKKMVFILGGMGVAVMLFGLYARKSAPLRSGLLFFLSLLITPLVAGLFKQLTDIYCPYELQEFGGQAFYQRVLELASPANVALEGGRCFPAGHASGGFALTMIFFCVPRKLRWPALFMALSLGWIMGLYQMFRGHHFLSHTLMSMLLAWQINLVLLYVEPSILTLVQKLRERA